MSRRLRIGGLLDRYVGRLFVASYATALLMVVGLFLILDLASNVDDYLQPDEAGNVPSSFEVVRYYLLSLPFIYLQVAPFVTLLAALFTVAKLARHNEVTAVLDAGVSAHRMMAPLFAGGVLAAAGMFGLREWATESLGHERFLLADRLVERRAEPRLENVWLKDRWGHPVRVESLELGDEDGAGARIEGLEVVIHDEGRWVNIEAEAATYVPGGRGTDEPGYWQLEGGVREDLDRMDTPGERLHVLEELEFSPQDVLVAEKANARPLELSFREARELAARDPDNVQYQTLLQYHLTFPLANVVLLLTGLPFLLRHRRGGGAEGVAAGFLLCVFFYGADFITRSLGMEGELSPLLASWLPLLFFGSLGVVLFGSLRS